MFLILNCCSAAFALNATCAIPAVTDAMFVIVDSF